MLTASIETHFFRIDFSPYLEWNTPLKCVFHNTLFQIERLKRKIRKMEDEHVDLTTRLNDTAAVNTTVNIQEV